MPEFTPEDISIDPDEYVLSCNSRELAELVSCLEEEGYVIQKPQNTNTNVGYDEEVYQEALGKLNGKWNMLSQAESEFITNLAKRF